MDKILKSAREKISVGERLNFDEIIALYNENDLLYLAESARRVKEFKSGKNIFYTINRHINLTNVCSSNCPLCAFQCRSGDEKAFTLEIDYVEKILLDAKKIPDLNEIHIVSALHPEKNFDYYLDVVKLTKKILPNVRIAAFTPVEIANFAEKSNQTYEKILMTLKNFGVTNLLGGGAEIFSPRVREIICPKKISADTWLEIMRIAHKLGIKSNASMLYGHIETIEERVEHLLKIRELQDETHGFQSMLLFPFQPLNTELGKKFNLQRVGAWEDLKMIAITRLALDNFENVKSFWVMLTMPIAQLSLAFGADDLGGTIGEEKIIHAAGVTTQKNISRADLEKIIRETNYIPVQR
ncbi:MAG: CofH family radical SAM protein [Selenomonadaceae bacterium]|nr:CofH family radical SAM protein [Selenomonadaceae bacterium]